MKILGIVLAILFLLSTAFVGITGANKARDAGSKISQATEMLGGGDSKLTDELPSAGRLKTGGIVGLVAGVGALVLLVLTFAKKSAVPGFAALVLGLSALAALIYPYVQTGPLDGMAPRPQAILALVLGIVGATGSLLAARKKA
jgi:hypothetical protein